MTIQRILQINEDTTGTKQAEDTFSVAMVTDVGGVDDKSFNQSAWEGIKQFGDDNGLSRGDGGFDYLQSASDADYNTNLNNLLRRDFDLVFGVGFMMRTQLVKWQQKILMQSLQLLTQKLLLIT